MTLLTALGTASFLFVVAFTYRAYYATHTAGQSPRSSIAEAWMNILIGFSVNFVVNIALLPLVNASFTASENFMLGWIYTAISIVRQYAVRRWWNARLHALAISLDSPTIVTAEYQITNGSSEIVRMVNSDGLLKWFNSSEGLNFSRQRVYELRVGDRCASAFNTITRIK